MNALAVPNTVNIVAISGGLGSPSSTRLLVDRMLSHTQKKLNAEGLDADVTVIELRPLAVQIANHLITGYPEPALATALAAVRDADGLIAVTPVFNASMSGLFKSFFDLLTSEDLAGKPISLGATGGSARHSLVIDFALRPLFAYLHATPLQTGMFVATADWGSVSGTHEVANDLERRASHAAAELATAVSQRRTLQAGRDPGAPLHHGEHMNPILSSGFMGSTQQERHREMQHNEFSELMSRFGAVQPTI